MHCTTIYMHKFCRKKMLAPHNIKSSAHTSLTVTAFWSHGNYPCIYSQRVAFNFFVFSCPGSSRTRESLEESIPPSTPYYFFFSLKLLPLWPFLHMVAGNSAKLVMTNAQLAMFLQPSRVFRVFKIQTGQW